MTTLCGRIPPGPAERFSTTQNLLGWMGEQFLRYGDTYKASIYGTSVYATRNLQHAQHVLHENSRNYVKGQAIKRVELLLGNGLMVSEGEFWRTQRRMVQHAFHHSAVEGLCKIVMMIIANQLRLHLVETDPTELDVGVNLRSKNDFIMNPELKASA
jgi:cytochrome P450